jgi:hypothetical protein
MSILSTFYTATLIFVAVRSTIKSSTVGITGTEVDANTVSTIAVKLVSDLSTILGSTGISGKSAIVRHH